MSAPAADQLTVAELMRDVDALERAPSKEAADLARSLIAMKVARLTGEGVQAAFDVLRAAPLKPMTVGRIGAGAIRQHASPDLPLDQVVARLATKLELVPVRREQDDLKADDVPWVQP